MMWHNVIENEKIQLWENYLLPFSHELPIVLLCPHELPFCAQKPFPSTKAVNSNGQSDNTL
jgi:hypothetical protein